MMFHPFVRILLASLLLTTAGCAPDTRADFGVQGLSACAVRVSGDHYIAGLLPFDGAWPIGATIEAAMIQALVEINANGGVHDANLGLVVCNTRGDADLAVRALAEVIQAQPISAVVGPMRSSSALRAAQIATRDGIVMISPSASTLTIDGTPFSEWVFQLAPEAAVQGLVASKMVQSAGVESALAIHVDDASARSIVAAFLSDLTGVGKSVEAIAFTNLESDFAEKAVSAAAALQPQGVFLIASPAEGASILRVASERGFVAQRWFFSTELRDTEFVHAVANQSFLDGAFGLGAVDPGRPETRAMGGGYFQMWGELPGPYAAHAYDAVYLLAIAMQLAADPRDRDMVRAALGRTHDGTIVRPNTWAAMLREAASGSMDYEGASGSADLEALNEGLRMEQWLLNDGQFDTVACWTAAAERCDLAAPSHRLFRVTAQ